jgi:hypothetical protein
MSRLGMPEVVAHALCAMPLSFPASGQQASIDARKMLMWGRMVSCGRVVLGLPTIVQMPTRPSTTRPQVANLPHIKPRARTNQYRCPVVGKLSDVAARMRACPAQRVPRHWWRCPAENLRLCGCSPGIPMSRDAARTSAHATGCRLAFVRAILSRSRFRDEALAPLIRWDFSKERHATGARFSDQIAGDRR